MDQEGAKKNVSHELGVLSEILNTPSIEKIYFNGFSNSIGSGDIVIVLYSNGAPIKVLNTSYTIAKTLAEKLTAMVQVFEKTTGNMIMTTDFIQSKIK